MHPPHAAAPAPGLPSSAEILTALERELTRGPVSPSPFSAATLDLYVEAFAGTFDGGFAVSSLIETAAAEHPEELFAWLNQRGCTPWIFGPDAGPWYASTLFSIWAKNDLEAALAAAPHLTFPARRACALTAILDHLATSDPARARALFLEHLDLFARIPELPAHDPLTDARAVFQFCSTLPPGRARGNLLARIMRDTSLFNPAPASWWKEAPPDVKEDLIAARFITPTAGEWSSTPPAPFEGMEELARARAESSGTPAAALTFLTEHGESWASRDPAAALAWSMSRLAGRARLDTTCKLFHSAAASQFDAAVSLWQSLPPGILKAKAAGALLNGAPDDRKTDARALLETLTPHDRATAQPASDAPP